MRKNGVNDTTEIFKPIFIMDSEKVYCYESPRRDCDMSWWALTQNQWMNNPIALMFVPMIMRMAFGDDWRNRMDSNPEIQARFNQLQGQLSDNHNTDILNDAIKGNYARLGELAGTLNVDLRALQSGICDLRAALQANGGDMRQGFAGLQGDIRFTGERIINAGLMGDKDLQATFKDCCCQSKELIQRMGYENQLSIKDQTYQLNDRMTGIANGMTKGFSDLGYILAQMKGDITLNQDRNTQRILDQMCQDKTQALRDLLAQKDRELLAANIIAGVKKDGCGCGCGVA